MRAPGPSRPLTSLPHRRQGLDDAARIDPSLRGGVVQDHPVGELAGQGQGLGSPCAHEQLGHGGRRPTQLHVLEMHVAAVPRDALAGQQVTHCLQVLAQQCEGGGDTDSGLAHPVQDAVAEARAEPMGKHARQRRDLHGGERRGPQGRRHDPDADPQMLGRTQDRSGRCDAAAREAVLPQPQVVQPRGLGGACHLEDALGGQVRRCDQADVGSPDGLVEVGLVLVGRHGRHSPTRRAPGQQAALLGPAAPQADGSSDRRLLRRTVPRTGGSSGGRFLGPAAPQADGSSDRRLLRRTAPRRRPRRTAPGRAGRRRRPRRGAGRAIPARRSRPAP